MLEIILAVAILIVAFVLAWIIGIICTLWVIADKHPHAYAEIAANRERGGKDGLSS